MSIANFVRDILTSFCNNVFLESILNNVRINITLQPQQQTYSRLLRNVMMPTTGEFGDVLAVPTSFTGNPLLNMLTVYGSLYFMTESFSYPIGSFTVTFDVQNNKIYVLLNLTYGTRIRHTDSYECSYTRSMGLDNTINQLMSAVRQIQQPTVPPQPAWWQPYTPQPYMPPAPQWLPQYPAQPPSLIESLISQTLRAYQTLYEAPTPARIEELRTLSEFERRGREIVSTAISAAKAYACDPIMSPREYNNPDVLASAVVGSVDCLLSTIKGKSYTCYGGTLNTAPGCILSEIIVYIAKAIATEYFGINITDILSAGYISDTAANKLKIDITVRGGSKKDICTDDITTEKAVKQTIESCGIPEKYAVVAVKRAPVAYLIAKAFMSIAQGEVTPEDVKNMMESIDVLEDTRKALDSVMGLFSGRAVIKSDAEHVALYTAKSLAITLGNFYIDSVYPMEEQRRQTSKKPKISKMCARFAGEPPEYLYISTPLLCSIAGISIGRGEKFY